MMRGSAEAAQMVHTHQVTGSSPVPANFCGERREMGFKDPLLRGRLKACGLWQAAIDYREELKADGYVSQDAQDMMEEKYIPLLEMKEKEAGVESKVKKDVDPRNLTVSSEMFVGKPEATYEEEMRWVAEVISRNNVKPKEAPSLVAWNMYLFYRENQNDFFKVYKGLKVDSKRDVEPFTDDGRMIKILEEVERESLASKEYIPKGWVKEDG
jgi:hypothetical protein